MRKPKTKKKVKISDEETPLQNEIGGTSLKDIRLPPRLFATNSKSAAKDQNFDLFILQQDKVWNFEQILNRFKRFRMDPAAVAVAEVIRGDGPGALREGLVVVGKALFDGFWGREDQNGRASELEEENRAVEGVGET
ncbi:hypothetical protein Bca4012_083348 [Brassica carinata]